MADFFITGLASLEELTAGQKNLRSGFRGPKVRGYFRHWTARGCPCQSSGVGNRAQPGGRERGFLRASGRQDAGSERPARWHGQPRARTSEAPTRPARWHGQTNLRSGFRGPKVRGYFRHWTARGCPCQSSGVGNRAQPGGRERGFLRASGRQDADSERPARWHGQPRARTSEAPTRPGDRARATPSLRPRPAEPVSAPRRGLLDQPHHFEHGRLVASRRRDHLHTHRQAPAAAVGRQRGAEHRIP